MSLEFRHTTPEDVVGKVLRRAEVAKMARKLHDRLALASYKTQHGQENLSFSDVEARLEKTIQRKRPISSLGTSSSTSSSSSDRQFFSGGLASSPLSAPFSSDEIRNSVNTRVSRKRNVYQSTSMDLAQLPSKRVRSQSTAPPLFDDLRPSWKSTHNLPESSPIYRHHESHFSSSNGPNMSFASDISTIPASPTFGHVSDDDDNNDMPTHSFSINSTFRSSPPRTPPPTRGRAARQRKGANEAGEEGADLLLYLATSPSPANPGPRASQIYAPSTPPSKNQALPSSMMSTPGIGGFNTPGQFNFADFVNITPSPAQGAFGNRTPGIAKTPLAAKEARRRLNFDTLIPPGGSPNISNVGRGSMNKDSGLGMELGGELVS